MTSTRRTSTGSPPGLPTFNDSSTFFSRLTERQSSSSLLGERQDGKDKTDNKRQDSEDKTDTAFLVTKTNYETATLLLVIHRPNQ